MPRADGAVFAHSSRSALASSWLGRPFVKLSAAERFAAFSWLSKSQKHQDNGTEALRRMSLVRTEPPRSVFGQRYREEGTFCFEVSISVGFGENKARESLGKLITGRN